MLFNIYNLTFLLFSGTDWSVRGTNTDPGQLGGGEVSVCHSSSKSTLDIWTDAPSLSTRGHQGVHAVLKNVFPHDWTWLNQLHAWQSLWCALLQGISLLLLQLYWAGFLFVTVKLWSRVLLKFYLSSANLPTCELKGPVWKIKGQKCMHFFFYFPKM